jgi:hypothetical protein
MYSWELETRLEAVANRLSITPAMRNRQIESLSGGERKRVALATALAQVWGLFGGRVKVCVSALVNEKHSVNFNDETVAVATPSCASIFRYPLN